MLEKVDQCFNILTKSQTKLFTKAIDERMQKARKDRPAVVSVDGCEWSKFQVIRMVGFLTRMVGLALAGQIVSAEKKKKRINKK